MMIRSFLLASIPDGDGGGEGDPAPESADSIMPFLDFRSMLLRT